MCKRTLIWWHYRLGLKKGTSTWRQLSIHLLIWYLLSTIHPPSIYHPPSDSEHQTLSKVIKPFQHMNEIQKGYMLKTYNFHKEHIAWNGHKLFLIFGCLPCPRDACEHHNMEPFSSKGLLKVIFNRGLVLSSMNQKPFVSAVPQNTMCCCGTWTTKFLC